MSREERPGMPNPTNQRTRRGRDAVPARRFASVEVAADYADVSTRTIRRYIADGRLTGYRVGPRLVKVDLADLDALVRPIPTAGC
jgi:excisionase family DNA binding protein